MACESAPIWGGLSQALNFGKLFNTKTKNGNAIFSLKNPDWVWCSTYKSVVTSL
jgi:hypothetical protein